MTTSNRFKFQFVVRRTSASGAYSALCFDAKSGKAHFEAERLSALSGVYASPVAAGGRVYVVGRTGSAGNVRSRASAASKPNKTPQNGFGKAG
jgi:hypothetical protein